MLRCRLEVQAATKGETPGAGTVKPVKKGGMLQDDDDKEEDEPEETDPLKKTVAAALVDSHFKMLLLPHDSYPIYFL